MVDLHFPCHSADTNSLSSFSFLAPLNATLILYPYSILSDEDLTVNFLIFSYSLNVLFAIFPLFASTRFLNISVSLFSFYSQQRISDSFCIQFQNYLKSVWRYAYREPNWRIKKKLVNIFEIYTKNNPITYSFFHFFTIDLRFALNVGDSFKQLKAVSSYPPKLIQTSLSKLLSESTSLVMLLILFSKQ